MSSTTITLRISKKNNDYLHKRAEQERVSVNIIANKIFNEYIEWQQFIEKFGTVVLSKEAFFMLIDVIDEHELINLGIKIGSKTTREFILFKWKEITNENVIEFIKMFSTHCINGEYDYTTTIDNKIFIILKHNTGIKGSIFLKYYFKSVIQETLQQEPNIETTDNSIIIKLLT